MQLSIIVVSYNTSSLLKQCLSSVYKVLSSDGISKKAEVIVVDNASTDDSVKMVKKEFPRTKLIINKKNLGFAKANNQGIKLAKGKYILLLNSDTKVKKGAFLNLLQVMEKDRDIGVVGGKLLNKDGSIQPSVGFFPHLIKVFLWMSFLDDIPFVAGLVKPYHVEWKDLYKEEQEVDWVSGACFLVRKEVVGKAGLLDEKIFMYGEEMEWCWRIKGAGFSVVYTPEAEIFHYKEKSSSTGQKAGIDKEFSTLIYFYKKHKPVWQLIFVRVFLLFGALLRIFLFGIIGKYPDRINAYVKAIAMVRR